MIEQANVRLEGLSSAVDRNQSSRFRRTCGLFVAEWHDNGIESKPGSILFPSCFPIAFSTSFVACNFLSLT